MAASCAASAATAAAVLYTSDAVAQCEISSSSLFTEVKKITIKMAADTNNDGKLSDQELRDLFQKMDTNQDGKITFDEWHDFLVKSGLSPEKCQYLEKLFKELDKDNSGSISFDEFRESFHPDYAVRYARSVLVAFLTKGRFIAYTSDIGESARPVMPSWFVNARTVILRTARARACSTKSNVALGLAVT